MTKKELKQLCSLKKEIRFYEKWFLSHPNGELKQSDIYRERLCKCRAERDRLEKFISDIPDSKLRRIFELKFGEGMKWIQIPLHMDKEITADGARMACNRFLEKQKIF